MAGITVNRRPTAQEAMEAYTAQAAKRQQERAANFDAGYDAQNYGVSTSVSGTGPYGQRFNTQAEAPVNRMAATGLQRVNQSRTPGSTGGVQQGSMQAWTQAMSQMNKQPAPPPMPSRQAPIDMLDRTAGEQASYGQAKDAVGNETRGAADSLGDEMSAKGLGGAGLEGALLGGIIQKGQGELGDVNRTQAVDRMHRADQVQDENYQGGISQRGQDFQGRGQTIEAQQAKVSNAMRLMQLLQQRVI